MAETRAAVRRSLLRLFLFSAHCRLKQNAGRGSSCKQAAQLLLRISLSLSLSPFSFFFYFE